MTLLLINAQHSFSLACLLFSLLPIMITRIMRYQHTFVLLSMRLSCFSGDRRNFEFRPGNDLAEFDGSPLACATLDIYEDLDYEGVMDFMVVLVDVYPFYFLQRDNFATRFIVEDPAGTVIYVVKIFIL